MMVNGKMFPHLDVEPRAYRFRILNASNGRFFHFPYRTDRNSSTLEPIRRLVAAPVTRSAS